MPRSNAQESDGWSVWSATILFPVSERVHADTQGCGEFFLGHPGEPTNGDNILTTGEIPLQNPLALSPGDRARKLLFCQLMNVFSHFFLANRLTSSRSALSSNNFDACSKERPCFAWFARSFAGSHSNFMARIEYTPLA